MKITFSYLVTAFFTSHLSAERGLSPNTVASYSDCMRLLIGHLCRRRGIQPEAVELPMIDAGLVLEFLDSLEDERGNGPASRNQRLAAIKAFFHFLSRTVPELMHQNEQIQAIRQKKADHRPPPSLDTREVDAIQAVPDAATLVGARDAALLKMLYNTGARVQELVDCAVGDLRADGPPSVTLTGKGRKTRVVPLWQGDRRSRLPLPPAQGARGLQVHAALPQHPRRGVDPLRHRPPDRPPGAGRRRAMPHARRARGDAPHLPPHHRAPSPRGGQRHRHRQGLARPCRHQDHQPVPGGQRGTQAPGAGEAAAPRRRRAA